MCDDIQNAFAKPPLGDEAAAAAGIAVNANVAALQNVSLPKFWRHSPHVWFTHADAVFANHRVSANSTRVNYVLAALDEDGVRAVADLVGPHATFDAIRQRLIDAYDVPRASLFRSFVQPGGMGDRRPSQLLRDMRAILPAGIGEEALREFWLLKLPANVRVVVASLDCPLEPLAIRADHVMEACEAHAVEQVNREGDRIEGLEREIVALTRQVQALVASGSRAPMSLPQPRRRASPTSAHDVCYYHNLYGSAARKCRKPCAFFNNSDTAPDPTLSAKPRAEN